MTKDEFFDLLDSVDKFKPAAVRLEGPTHYHDPYCRLWVVGKDSADPTLVMAKDAWPILTKFKSRDMADKGLVKFQRWFKEWENEKA